MPTTNSPLLDKLEGLIRQTVRETEPPIMAPSFRKVLAAVWPEMVGRIEARIHAVFQEIREAGEKEEGE
jgi:hypothetical protein